MCDAIRGRMSWPSTDVPAPGVIMPNPPNPNPKGPRPDFSDVTSGSSSASSKPANQPVEREVKYTVQSGDSLSKIAQQQYGDGKKWRAIFEANRDQISNPDLIHPGQVLKIPSA
jgi:nucleoid-associated protein YgaU